MANITALEGFPGELINLIVCHLSIGDQSRLSRVSRRFHILMIRCLYGSWSYHGLNHSSKSLHYFLRTVIQNPQLADCVGTLDLREWGDCPRLEDNYNPNWYLEPQYQYHGGGEDWDSEGNDIYDGENGETADDPEDAPVNSIDNPVDENVGPIPSGKSDETYDDNVHLFEQALQDLGFGEENCPAAVRCFKCRIRQRDEDILVALLISRLPNLHILYLVMPEDHVSIQRMVTEAFELGKTEFLQSLRTLYICGALDVDIHGDRRYEIQLEDVLPFFQVKNLQSLYTLTSSSSESPYARDIKTDHLHQLSNLSELVFEEAQLLPKHISEIVSIPRALTKLSWSQEISCFSIGSCHAPIYHTIGESLRAHIHSLEVLNLDIRQGVCRGAGHAGNPNTRLDDVPSLSRNELEQIRQDAHMIGRLTNFLALKSLTISNSGLCGDRIRGLAPYRMVDNLPTTLETLKLIISIRHRDGELRRLEDNAWVDQLVEVVRSSNSVFTRLRRVHVLVARSDLLLPGDEIFFEEIEKVCSRSRIAFQVQKVGWKVATEQPFFKEITPVRRPGRDY